MNSDTHILENLHRRILTLENQNRRLKRAGLVGVISIISFVVMGQAPARKTMEANEFVLRDDNGNVRARLSMDDKGSGAQMVLLDEKGRIRIKLESGVGSMYGGMVSVFDTQGQQRGLFSARDVVGGGISLLDSRGRPRTTVSPGDVWVDGGVRLEDGDGFAAWLGKTGGLYEGERQTASAASLILLDNPHRKALWKAP